MGNGFMAYKSRVLFVCVANSARSQLAEALLRHTDSEHFEAFSAGTAPTQSIYERWQRSSSLALRQWDCTANRWRKWKGNRSIS